MADEFERQNEKKEKNEQSNQNNKSIQNEYDKQSEEEDKYSIEIQEPASVENIYNDYVEHEDYEYISKPEKEEEEEEEEEKYIPEIIDWEKEAKESVRIDTSTLKERQKTIYELDSFSASGIGAEEILQLASKDVIREPLKEIRYSTTLGIPGIARINLSPITQKIVGCVIGENVSTEYPWVYVRKKIIEDNIDLHEDSSDFLPVKDEIYRFPNSKMLIGYVPSLTEEGQFYICLTEEGRDAIVEYIQKEREDHENRVRTAVYKPIGKWKELTSSVEIDSMIVKNTRPLLEIELVTTADVLNAPIHFEDRKVDDVRDGYIELLPYRQIFENIPRKLLYNETQITPEYRTAKIQTELSIPINRWVQYEYTYKSPDIKKFTPEEQESLKAFLRYFTDYICDQLLVNATWDIYCNDYEDLVRNIRDTQCPIPITYKEYLSFHDEKHVVNKVINDLTWHPFWTGVVYTAYTSFAKSQHLIGPKSDEEIIKAYDNNYALVWSFNDSLVPKLVLECPREVTSVSVSPLDGNLVIGGCANGQLSIKNLKKEGLHGFHVHEKGDLRNGCTSTGPHFNPENVTHGGQDSPIRHVGDLGNIRANAKGEADVHIKDFIISLTGKNNILGRAIVVHSDEDDLGKGNSSLSTTTGNSGDRWACGIIEAN